MSAMIIGAHPVYCGVCGKPIADGTMCCAVEFAPAGQLIDPAAIRAAALREAAEIARNREAQYRAILEAFEAEVPRDEETCFRWISRVNACRDVANDIEAAAKGGQK